MSVTACAGLAQLQPLAATPEVDLQTLQVAELHPATHVQRLPSGVTLVVAEDARAPRVGVALLFPAGTRQATAEQAALAPLAATRFAEGTPEDPESPAALVRALGGTAEVVVRPDYAGLLISAPPAALAPIIRRLADWLGRPWRLVPAGPLYPLGYPLGYLGRGAPLPAGAETRARLRALAFARPGNRQEEQQARVVGAHVDAAALRGFLAQRYAPAGAVLALAGAVSRTEVLPLLVAALRGLPPPPPRADPQDLEEPLLGGDRWLSRGPRGAEGELALGYRLPPRGTRDHLAAAVLATVLCGQAGRLRRLVRERGLLAVEGGIDWPYAGAFDYDGPTLLVLRLRYRGLDAVALAARVQSEAERVEHEAILPAELLQAQQELRAQLYRSLEAPVQRARGLAVAQLLSGDATTLWEIPARASAVSALDLARVARTYLSVVNRVVLDRRPR